MKWDRTRLFLYGIGPAAVGVGMLALYFSGVPWLQNLASPSHQREFGLVENIQNITVISMIILCIRSAVAEKTIHWRSLWVMATVLAVGILMEEIDWGNHYYTALTGESLTDAEIHNIHNLCFERIIYFIIFFKF